MFEHTNIKPYPNVLRQISIFIRGLNHRMFSLFVSFLFIQSIGFSQCGSCTNPTGSITINAGQTICYDANTTAVNINIAGGTLIVCEGVTLSVAGALQISTTGTLNMNSCSQVLVSGSLINAGTNTVAYVGDPSYNAVLSVAGSFNLGPSLTGSSNISFCNPNSLPIAVLPEQQQLVV